MAVWTESAWVTSAFKPTLCFPKEMKPLLPHLIIRYLIKTLRLQVLHCIAPRSVTALCSGCWSGSIWHLYHTGVNRSAGLLEITSSSFCYSGADICREECNAAPRYGQPQIRPFLSRECQTFLNLKSQQPPFRSNDCWAFPGGWLSNFVKSRMPCTPVLTDGGIADYGPPCSPKETLSLIL